MRPERRACATTRRSSERTIRQSFLSTLSSSGHSSSICGRATALWKTSSGRDSRFSWSTGCHQRRMTPGVASTRTSIRIWPMLFAVQIHQQVERVSLVGYCLGALLSVFYAALHSREINNLVTLTLPLDMSMRDTPLYQWIDWLDEKAVVWITDVFGNCPSWLLRNVFNHGRNLPCRRISRSRCRERA